MITQEELHELIPFVKDIGMELVRAEDGWARLALEVLPRHLNGRGTAHGGVTMTLLDVAMSLVAWTLHLRPEGVVTIEMKTSFTRPGPTQGRLEATGTCVHSAGSLAFCEAQVRDAADELVAFASATFKLIGRRSEDQRQ